MEPLKSDYVENTTVTDNRPTLAQRGGDTTQTPIPALFTCQIIAKLDRTLRTTKQKQKSYKKWEQKQTMNKHQQITTLELTVAEATGRGGA